MQREILMKIIASKTFKRRGRRKRNADWKSAVQVFIHILLTLVEKKSAVLNLNLSCAMYWDRYPDSPLTRHFWKGLAQMVECALSIFFFAVSPSSPRVPPFSRVFCPFPPFPRKETMFPRLREDGARKEALHGQKKERERNEAGAGAPGGLEEGDQEPGEAGTTNRRRARVGRCRTRNAH